MYGVKHMKTKHHGVAKPSVGNTKKHLADVLLYVRDLILTRTCFVLKLKDIEANQ